jgi:hypothetical protein
VWHIDESVIPVESAFPIDTSLRANADLGVNTNPGRLGISIIEADALQDLGDLGSPDLHGAPYDPYFLSNNPTLSDTTAPNLIPNIRTRPHIRLDFLDNPDSTMHFSAKRVWALPGWPIKADFPPGGPQLLAVDATGERNLEVCWAGGADSLFDGSRFVPNPDSAALFAVRVTGQGLSGPSLVFGRLDSLGRRERRPRPEMAAIALGGSVGPGLPDLGPSLFAVSTFASGPDTSAPGGRVWLVDHHGTPVPGWPAPLPAIVTTPPVITTSPPTVYVGCADGRVYGLDLNGAVRTVSDRALAGGVSGRLAVYASANLVIPGFSAHGSGLSHLVAAGGADGEVGVFLASTGATLTSVGSWPRTLGGPGFAPDFLWINFGVDGTDCFSGALSLVIHDSDRMWGYCAAGQPLSGWTGAPGDSIVAGLAAGDPDGDGYPEVLTQTNTSRLAYWNLSGRPSPGWPVRGTREKFRTVSPPLALDLDRNGRSVVAGMNASGILAAFRGDGSVPSGWPLATGLAAGGAPVAADLDQDGTLELVAPDRFGVLYGYSVPVGRTGQPAIAWDMLGGDPGRTSALILDAASTAPAPSSGPLVQGSLKVFPNPARRRPVSFAYQLTEPADVDFRIMDPSGHEVASFSRHGHQSDNLEVWDPGILPAGLYLARLHFSGANQARTEIVSIGVLK